MDFIPTQKHDDPTKADDLLAESTRIREQINALKVWFRRHPDMHCLLVVDPSQRDPVSGDGSPFADLPRTDVVIDHEAVSSLHYPCLLQLDLAIESGIHALEESVRLAFEDRRPQAMAEGLGQRIGGWLASSASPGEVAAHCARLALQRDDRDRLCLLRFYDSRALALMWAILSPKQRHALLGPIHAWHALDAGATAGILLNTAGRRGDFMLEPAQWQAIHHHGVVNRALALYAYDRNCRLRSHEVEAAVAAAARAHRYGLTDEDDEVAFVGHALAWHPQFDLHPRVLQILGDRSSGDLYTERIDELTQEDIQELREGTWHERLRTPDNASGQA